MGGGRLVMTGGEVKRGLRELVRAVRSGLAGGRRKTPNAFLCAGRPVDGVPPPHKNAVHDVIGARRLRKPSTAEKLAELWGCPGKQWARFAMARREPAARRAGARPRFRPRSPARGPSASRADTAEQFRCC